MIEMGLVRTSPRPRPSEGNNRLAASDADCSNAALFIAHPFARFSLSHNPKTKDDYTAKCRKLTDLLGYDEAARVTPEEIVRFKEHLLTSGFAPKSVQNVFAGVKMIFRFGVTNRKIATDPTAGISYKAKRDPSASGSRSH